MNARRQSIHIWYARLWIRGAVVVLVGCLLLPYSTQAASPPAPVSKTIHVAALPSLLALDPTTGIIYLRGRGQVDRYGASISGQTYSALNGRTGQVLHVWPDDPMAQTSTIPALHFFRTGNGMEAYLAPTALTKLGLTYVGIDRQAGYILGEDANNSTLVTVDLRTRHILHTWSYAGWNVGDLVLDPQSGWVAVVLANSQRTSAELLTFNARVRGTPVKTTYQPLLTEASIAVDEATNRVFVASMSDVEIYTLDTLHRVATISNLHYVIGFYPRDSYENRNWDSELVAVDSALERAIIINPADTNQTALPGYQNTLSLYGTALIVDDRTGRVLYKVPIGEDPTAVQVDAQLHRAYITNRLSHDVTILDMHTGKRVALVNTGVGPVSLVLDTASGEEFTANSGSNTVTMFPLTTTQGAKASYPPTQP
jgi:YVTN family beta-propeller protein